MNTNQGLLRIDITFMRLVALFRVLIRVCIEPRAYTEDERRKEFILNIILSGSIVLLATLDIFILRQSIMLGEVYRGISFPVFSLIVLFFVGLLILSRNGNFEEASYAMIGFYFLGSFYGAYHWGIDLQLSILSFILVIVVSSILIGTRFGFIVTTIVAFVTILLALLEFYGISEPLEYWKFEESTRKAVQYASMYFLIMTVSWLSNREIEKSLHRARVSEALIAKERDLLEIKVEERTKALEEAQSEKISQLYRFAEFGRLSSGMFHDLINPLTAVMNGMNSLKESVDPELPHIKDSLNRAVSANKRMEKFIIAVRKQIKQEEIEEVFSLNDSIEEVLVLLGYKALRANVSVSFSPKNVTMKGNPFKFEQVVLNLVSNAIDACADVEEKRKRIDITLLHTPEYVELSVRDQGKGMETSLMEHIFDSFFSTKNEREGMGLGLSTTKMIVKKDFNGYITVSSFPDKGSCFIVNLPYSNES